MLEQAKKIVAMFSGDGSSAKNRDICHVGSALFMGNNIKLMCSNQVDTLEQTIWNEYYYSHHYQEEGKEPKKYDPPTYYLYPGLDDNCPWKYSEPDDKGKRRRTNTVISGREDWIELKEVQGKKNNAGGMTFDYNNIKPMFSSDNAGGKPSGLLVKFNNWKDRWMSGSQDYVRSARSGSKDVDSDSIISSKSALRGVELEREVSEFDEPLTKMAYRESSTPVMRADVGGGGGGHSSSLDGSDPEIHATYTKYITNTYSYSKWTKKLAVHTGVPTWKETVDASQANDPDVIQVDGGYVKLHFGDVDAESQPGEVSSSFDWYFFDDKQKLPKNWVNPFANKFDFFTNNLGGYGKTTYDWPFYYDPNAKFKSVDVDGNNNQITKQAFRGVLTNMWAGCEPVCAILSKLLKDGFFCSYPWNVGLGYMFRKKSIPKLVFVFSNEFDNSFTATYRYG